MTLNELDVMIKKGDFKNCYIFCGTESEMIVEAVNKLTEKAVGSNLRELNHVKFDGSETSFDTIYNACETMPFMSDWKVVIVSRSEFLKDGKGSSAGDEVGSTKSPWISYQKYIENIPPYTILILYYGYESNREKLSKKVKKLESKAVVVEFKKLTGKNLEKRVKELFEIRNKSIGTVELGYFCNLVENEIGNIENEVEKLCCYCGDKEITKKDILFLLPEKKDNDIFDLVESISYKRPEQAMNILSELLYKGEKIPMILNMIERQFKQLLAVKLCQGEKVQLNIIQSKLKLPEFIFDRMVTQCNRFSLKQLSKTIELCLETEKLMKSSTINPRTEIEMLILKALMADVK